MSRIAGIFIFTSALFLSLLSSADEIMIDKIDFEGAALNKALAFISTKCSGKNTVMFSAGGLAKGEMPLLTMSFRNIPLDDLIRYICMETGMKYRKTEHAYLVGKNIDGLYIEQYNATVVPATATLANIKECLAAYGVTFPEGSTINYNKKTNMLTVKNSGPNHNIIENIFLGTDWIDVRRKPANEKDAEFTFTDIKEKLKKIRSSVEFKNESVLTVLKYISLKTREKDPSGKGINILFFANGTNEAPAISLDIDDMSTGDILNYIATLLGMKCKIEDYAVLIIPKTQTAPAIPEKTEN